MNLSDLLHDAVDEIEPADRLDEIRARTTSSRGPRRWYAAGGAMVAVAATVTTFALLSPGPPDRDEPGPAAAPEDQLVAAYFIGDTPAGPRLFREFDRVPAGDPLQAALDRIQETPEDPDYSTPWEPGSFRSATVRDGRIEVEMGGLTSGRGLAIQQVVHTLQAAVGRRLPVSFAATGQTGGAPVQARSAALSPVSISDPAEGNDYAGAMIARGRAVGAQGQVEWQLRESGTVVRNGVATVTGGEGLSPWEVEVDLRGLAPGSYEFVVLAGGGGIAARTTDTRTITVR